MSISIDRKSCGDDYMEIFDETVEGEPYSDDELRAVFRKGLRRLENRGDYDMLLMYSDSVYNREDVTVVIWKALAAAKVHSENLTGRQLSRLYEILKDEFKK